MKIGQHLLQFLCNVLFFANCCSVLSLRLLSFLFQRCRELNKMAMVGMWTYIQQAKNRGTHVTTQVRWRDPVVGGCSLLIVLHSSDEPGELGHLLWRERRKHCHGYCNCFAHCYSTENPRNDFFERRRTSHMASLRDS